MESRVTAASTAIRSRWLPDTLVLKAPAPCAAALRELVAQCREFLRQRGGGAGDVVPLSRVQRHVVDLGAAALILPVGVLCRPHPLPRRYPRRRTHPLVGDRYRLPPAAAG